DYHNVDLLSNDSLLKPDQGHDHGNLTPWCHTKPEDEAVLSAQSRQSTRDGTADNLCYDRDEGENDQEPQDGHRELVHIGKDAKRDKEDRGKDHLEVLRSFPEVPAPFQIHADK